MGDVTRELACANCGATDQLWAWYPEPTRQTITPYLEDGQLRYDYTGTTRTADDAGDDESFMCVACDTQAETLEELLGMPAPPLRGRTLTEWQALALLLPGPDPEPDASFPSGADFIDAVVEHFGFTRESFVAYCNRVREGRIVEADDGSAEYLGKREPDYSDKPTVIVGVELNANVGDSMVGLSFVGFEPPPGVRVIVRDHSAGSEPDEHGNLYEDHEL